MPSESDDRRAGISETNAMPPVGGQDMERDVEQAELEREAGNAVRDYLRSIGEHPLLTAKDEVALGLKVERWVRLRTLRSEYESAYGRPPTPAQLAADIYRAIADKTPLVRALSLAAGTRVNGRRYGLLHGDRMRDLLDMPYKPEPIGDLAGGTGWTQDEVKAGIVALSELSGLLPPEVLDTIDEVSGPEGVLPPEDVEPLLDEHTAELERWWRTREKEGRAATERMVSSNLRLVVSVAQRIVNSFEPRLTKEAYLALQRGFNRRVTFDGANG